MQDFCKLGSKFLPSYSLRLSVVPTRVDTAISWTLSCPLNNLGEKSNSIDDMSCVKYCTAVTNIRNIAQLFGIANENIVSDANRFCFYGRSTICDANTYDVGFNRTILAGFKNTSGISIDACLSLLVDLHSI